MVQPILDAEVVLLVVLRVDGRERRSAARLERFDQRHDLLLAVTDSGVRFGHVFRALTEPRGRRCAPLLHGRAASWAT